jgi:hypothetical protein
MKKGKIKELDPRRGYLLNRNLEKVDPSGKPKVPSPRQGCFSLRESLDPK